MTRVLEAVQAEVVKFDEFFGSSKIRDYLKTINLWVEKYRSWVPTLQKALQFVGKMDEDGGALDKDFQRLFSWIDDPKANPVNEEGFLVNPVNPSRAPRQMDLEKVLGQVNDDLLKVANLAEEADSLTDPDEVANLFSEVDDSPRVVALQKLQSKWLDATGDATNSLNSAIDEINSAIEAAQEKWQEIIDHYAEE